MRLQSVMASCAQDPFKRHASSDRAGGKVQDGLRERRARTHEDQKLHTHTHVLCDSELHQEGGAAQKNCIKDLNEKGPR